jgi:restriction endonuclease
MSVGRKLIKDERNRQILQRRQQAKAGFRQYVNEASMSAQKNSRDALRRVQRQLRDEFIARAESLHESSGRALHSARRVIDVAPAHREQEGARVDDALDRLQELARRAQGREQSQLVLSR